MSRQRPKSQVVGEVTPQRLALARKGTAIAEKELKGTRAFQYVAILRVDRFTGIRDGKREFGAQVEVRCWESVDARAAKPAWLSSRVQQWLAQQMTSEVPGVLSVTCRITPKPPSTKEAV